MLREEQCGFRKNTGCSDHLFALRQVLEKFMTYKLDVTFFIDFSAVFDTVDRIMEHYLQDKETLFGSTKNGNFIHNSYEGFKCCVKAQCGKRQMFDVKSGFRQGDVWSTILFGLVISKVLANSAQGGIHIGGCVADRDFTNVFALLGVSESEVGEYLHRNEFLTEAVGLKINVVKKQNKGVKCEKPGTNVALLIRKEKFSQEIAKAEFGLSLWPKTNPINSLARSCWLARRRMRAGSRG